MNVKQYSIMLGIIAGLGLISCSKNLPEEINSLEVDRAFSPVGLEARLIDRTSVRLSWSKVKNADSYTIELFAAGDSDFSGSSERIIEEISFEQVPYTLVGLDGDTDYAVRVKAVGKDIQDSKWSTAVFTTLSEQIFTDINPEELLSTSVVLNWTAGQKATQILIQPGQHIHQITDAEIAAGKAQITGLIGETSYTATLLNGSKVRGSMPFTTLLDLGDAIAVTEADDLTALVEHAAAGTVFALMPGTYTLGNLSIKKSISIKGAKPADRPILNSVVFKLDAGAGLALKDLIINGTAAANDNQAFIYDADGIYEELKIEDCEIKNYIKGLLYVNKAALIQNILLKGNIISNIEGNGGEFIDMRLGFAKTLEIINNTIYNSVTAREFLRIDANGGNSFPSNSAIVKIINNTFYNVSNGNSRRFLYVRLPKNEITFSKNIVAETEGYYTNQSATNLLLLDKNNYWNAPNMTGSTVSGAKNDKGNYSMLHPGFSNVSAGNFQVTHEELRFSQIGDPRWIK